MQYSRGSPPFLHDSEELLRPPAGGTSAGHERTPGLAVTCDDGRERELEGNRARLRRRGPGVSRHWGHFAPGARASQAAAPVSVGPL